MVSFAFMFQKSDAGKGVDNVQERTGGAETSGKDRTVPMTMLKRIGSTTYEVAVYFSQTSKETVNDKITRLIQNEASGEKTGEQRKC